MNNEKVVISDPPNNSCSMVGFLGIIIQLALGVLSFSVLILKRFRQNPRRPWKIWIFDTSKQLISQMLAHFINLTISIALTYQDSSSDECLWYFTTNILDNTVGVLLCVFCLVFVEKQFVKNGKREYVSGNYYSCEKQVVIVQIIEMHQEEFKYRNEISSEMKQQGSTISGNGQNIHNQLIQQKDVIDKQSEQREKDSKISVYQNHQSQQVEQIQHSQTIQRYIINYKAWLVQLGVWILITIIGKSILFGFEFGLQGPMKELTLITMGWIEDYQILQLVVVIVIVPVIMNGFAFWVQDNFLMKKQEFSLERPLVSISKHSKNDIN